MFTTNDYCLRAQKGSHTHTYIYIYYNILNIYILYINMYTIYLYIRYVVFVCNVPFVWDSFTCQG